MKTTLAELRELAKQPDFRLYVDNDTVFGGLPSAVSGEGFETRPEDLLGEFLDSILTPDQWDHV